MYPGSRGRGLRLGITIFRRAGPAAAPAGYREMAGKITRCIDFGQATAHNHAMGIRNNMALWKRLTCLAALTQCLFACSALPPLPSFNKPPPEQSRRLAIAQAETERLKKVDAVVKLDNQKLSREIRREIMARAKAVAGFDMKDIQVSFGQQVVELQAALSISDKAGNSVPATAAGDIVFDYSGDHLEWIPHFQQLNIQADEFTWENATYGSPQPALQADLLARLNNGLFEPLVLHDLNVIPLRAVPLGTLEVGVALPGLGNAEARQSKKLNGVFIVKSSAVLIEKRATTVALDLGFIPDFSNCPADVRVSRAGFTRQIKNHEPVGLVHHVKSADDVHFFYTEISGAKRPLTIIHYWFEDGEPLAVEELPVGSSKRWRTWSSKVAGHPGAHRWEVLVVEKESGCILHTQSITKLAAKGAAPSADEKNPATTFDELRKIFNARLAGYTIQKQKPGIALIEVDRSFLERALATSLADQQMEVEIDTEKLNPIISTASLQPFDSEGITCSQTACPPAPECAVSLTQCKRMRDTRDCSKCLFRNPLNNRCVSQATDPICEAARRRQNIKYQVERSKCISAAETAKQDCEALWEQLKRSCEIEAGFEISSCEAVKAEIAGLPEGALVATARAQAALQGPFQVSFSNFRIEDGFRRLQLDLSLGANLSLKGKLAFNPEEAPQTLNSCIRNWHAPFAAQVVPPAQASSLLADLESEDHTYTSNWSGYVLSVTTRPTPLEAVFRQNPRLLANCTVHLSIDDVNRALVGSGAEFYNGSLQLEIQPLPTHISLAPASIEYADRAYRGEASITAERLKYDIRN